jgi:hypothetical protein
MASKLEMDIIRKNHPVCCSLRDFRTGKVPISRRAYEGLRVVLCGDPGDVLMVGQLIRHLARLPAISCTKLLIL